MEEINCKFCGTLFIPNRLGMEFCRSKCWDDYKNFGGGQLDPDE